jgi:hypothetical protein
MGKIYDKTNYERELELKERRADIREKNHRIDKEYYRYNERVEYWDFD